MNNRDDLDELKAAMTAATPAPSSDRRAENTRLAQENFKRHQESRKLARPNPVTAPKGLWIGAADMIKRFSTYGGLSATTAIVACGFVIFTPVGKNLWRDQPTTLTEAQVELKGAEQTEFEAITQPDPVVSPPAATLSEEIALAEISERVAPVAVDAQASRSIDQAAPNAAVADDGLGFADMIEPSAPIVATSTDSEAFSNAAENPVKVTLEEPVSTFSIDVDTASYAIIRNSLYGGVLPPTDAVRIEEMINYFPYNYRIPEADDAPFRPTINVFETPWNGDTQLVHIALQGRQPAIAERPNLNLVFLIDTSGSMNDPAKLPLLKQSFRLLLNELRPGDEVAIVEYAGSAGLVLEPTPASERSQILSAINSLGAGGSTNGQGGLEQAYAVASQMAENGEIGRVILATDGDFNVGLSDPSALEDFIATKRESGTFLSVLGFGRGNLDDATMQALAQNGNGTAAYIDTLNEAQKVLVDQLSGALFPIANDVKIQVEFNPSQVAEYRLIGYETRALRREDFNNDKVDAGELGAGHSVTAMYEITPVGSPARLTDPLRYQSITTSAENSELGFLKLRWKEPGETESVLMETPFLAGDDPDVEALFAASIAGFGQLLRGGTYLGDWSWDHAIDLANNNRGTDMFGYRTEAVQLMRLAKSLSEQ